MLTFLLSLALWFGFDTATADMQFREIGCLVAIVWCELRAGC